MPQTNRSNVEAHLGVDIITEREIYLVAFEFCVLAKVPPVIDQMPRWIANAVGSPSRAEAKDRE